MFLFDSKSLRLKKLKINKNEPLKIYICGITPYDYAHIGHARCYIIYDILIRTLKYFEIDFLYCRNITDIDDKILKKAKIELGDEKRFLEISEKFYKIFEGNLNDLNCLKPNYEPKVTENIEEIINFIEELIRKEYAYFIPNEGVYFSIDSFKKYGELSKRKLDEQDLGNRIKIDENKKNPMDFALWKLTEEKEVVFWNSTWGKGLPGWHIECSVMANKILGNTIDIHGGGMDLIFPHHENEKAQSECHNNCDFVDIWMHIAFVCIDKEKMSKSLANFITISEALEQFDPMVLRYYFLQNHYRTPFNFSWIDLKACEKGYKKLINFFEKVDNKKNENFKSENLIKLENYISEDLNTAKCLGLIHEIINKNERENLNEIKYFIVEILGLNLNKIKEEKIEYSQEILNLIEEREIARKNKNFKRSDEIREILKNLNVEINDLKN